MTISSEALGKTKERSETKDTTVSLQEATSRTDDDIVQSLQKCKKYFGGVCNYQYLCKKDII